MYLSNRILEVLLLPPAGPLLLIAVGLCAMRRWAAAGRCLAWCGVALALASMTPATVSPLLAPLEDVAAFDAAKLGDAGAVVILGGGRRVNAPEFGGETVNRLTLERLRYGARVARQTGLPILVSGGLATEDYPPEAWLMHETLIEDFDLPARWVEDRSANTAENARYSAALLRRDGIGHVVLVTHAAHMRRAQGWFEAAGLRVTPAATGHQGGQGFETVWLGWLPSQTWSYAGWYALHEWAGLLQQRLALIVGGTDGS